MDRPAVNPTALPPGTRVGSWQVTGFRCRDVYGSVYRAVHHGNSRGRPAALKLAIYPADPRFEREVELLSRIRHPSVPRLLDAGRWSDGLGRAHPFLVQVLDPGRRFTERRMGGGRLRVDAPLSVHTARESSRKG